MKAMKSVFKCSFNLLCAFSKIFFIISSCDFNLIRRIKIENILEKSLIKPPNMF